jgi:hypothetical protein
LISPKGFDCKENGNFFVLDDIVIEADAKLLFVAFVEVSVFCLLFLDKKIFGLYPNESSFILL